MPVATIGAGREPPQTVCPSIERLGVHNTIADLVQLAHHCAKVNSLKDLASHIEAAVRDIGFRWFTLVRTVDLQKDNQNGVIIQDYPNSWFEEIIEKRLFDESAVLAASARSVGGICWSKVYKRSALTARQRTIRTRECDHGLNSGFTISMPIIGAPSASFTVARHPPDAVSEHEKVAVRAVAAIGLEHALRISSIETPQRLPCLSARQRECTALVAQGKTDWEIAQIIGIGRDTVHEYVEAARKKYDVRTRPQLVLAAFKNGEINEIDIFPTS